MHRPAVLLFAALFCMRSGCGAPAAAGVRLAATDDGSGAAGEETSGLEALTVPLGRDSLAERVTIYPADTAGRMTALQAFLERLDDGANRAAAHAVNEASAKLGIGMLAVRC